MSKFESSFLSVHVGISQHQWVLRTHLALLLSNRHKSMSWLKMSKPSERVLAATSKSTEPGEPRAKREMNLDDGDGVCV